MNRHTLLGMVLILLPHICTGADLAVGAGDDLVRGHCSGCHSLRLVTAQRGDRDYWLKTIRWMQRTQNLWVLPPAQEAVILDYLAEHYAESEWGRRPNLSPLLQPLVGK